MKPLEKEIKKKNDKISYKKINSERLKVTTEDNYERTTEKNTKTGKKSKKRKIKKKPVIEEKDFPKETKCLSFSKFKIFLNKHKILLILSLLVIIILVVILISLLTKKKYQKR